MTPESIPAAPHREGLTVREKILIAAVELGDAPFDVDTLIVRAWKLFPESFSLTGGEHPDSNRVLAKLSGEGSLLALGWLERVAPSTYQLTCNGASVARRIGARAPRAAPRELHTEGPSAVEASAVEASAIEAPPRRCEALSPEDVAAIATLARSEALRKFLRGSPLAFVDAATFWRFSAKRPREVDARIAATGAIVERVANAFDGEGPVDPKLPARSTCYGLLNLHRLMLGRFARELEAARAQEAAHA